MRRSPEETIEAAHEDEELADAVELAELEGASLAEAALGEPEPQQRTALSERLGRALEGVELPEETVARPRPKRRARAEGPRKPGSRLEDGRSPATRGGFGGRPPGPITALDVAGVDLRVRLGALELNNPVMSASGCFGWGRDYEAIFAPGLLGGIVTKGTTPRARPGNPQYRIVETPSGILNSIGLENPGAEGVAKKYAPAWRDIGAPVIVNVAGYSLDDYVFVIRTLDGSPGVAAFELNISCPNVEGGLLFGCDPGLAAQVTSAARAATDLPLIVKLTPNATDVVAVALAIESAGADALTCMNTVLAMRIDPQRQRPVLGTRSGGLSGPAIRPIAVHLTYQLAQRVKIPIVGAGGVTNAEDALEFLLAGATAVQVGTATFADPLAPVRVIEGLAAYVRGRKLASIREVIGAALPRGPEPETRTEYVE